MTRSWHFVTGEYPPQHGGVSDYTALIATAMVSAGERVHVWAPGTPDASSEEIEGVQVHRVPGGFDGQALQLLDHGLDGIAGARILLVQYVPHAFGKRAMNVGFCRWVRRRAHGPDDVRVMFHEPYYPFTAGPPQHLLLAAVNRWMARLLLSDVGVAYVSTLDWVRRLSPYAPQGRRFEWLPVPSTIPAAGNPAAIATWRRRLVGDPNRRTPLVVHFGTYGHLVTHILKPALEALLSQDATVRIGLVGEGSAPFAERLCAEHPEWSGRVVSAGCASADDVAACLAAADVALQPYADGASGRRTSLMAALRNGVAVVSNRGVATEAVWGDGHAIELVDSSEPQVLAAAVLHLLADEPERVRIARAGQALYALHFGVEHTIQRLLLPAQVKQ